MPSGNVKWIFVAPQPVTATTGTEKTTDKTQSVFFSSIPQANTARREFKPLMIYFYCGDPKNPLARGCHTLNSVVFTTEEIVKKSGAFVCLAVDFMKLHNSLKIQYKVRAVPTIVFVDSFGVVITSLAGGNINWKAFLQVMETSDKKNRTLVDAYKARLEALKKDTEKADGLLDSLQFEEARKILDKLEKNDVDPDVAEFARTKKEEIGMGVLFQEAVKALDEKNFDLAKTNFDSIANSQIANRWGSRAYMLARGIPAAKAYYKAVDLMEAKNMADAMEAFDKVTSMEYAGQYAEMALKKIEEIKSGWGK